MDGPWLASYIALWGIVLFQGFIIFVLLRQMGLIYLGTAQGVARDGIPVGRAAPDFSAADVQGRSVALADFRGQPLLLVFGSPTCKPCQNLIPDLNAFARERAEEMSVLFVSRGDAHSNAEFAHTYGIEVPILTHEDSSLADRYRARVTPFGFLIDEDGIVRAKGLANHKEHLEMLVKAAFDREPAAERDGVAHGRNGQPVDRAMTSREG